MLEDVTSIVCVCVCVHCDSHVRLYGMNVCPEICKSVSEIRSFDVGRGMCCAVYTSCAVWCGVVCDLWCVVQQNLCH